MSALVLFHEVQFLPPFHLEEAVVSGERDCLLAGSRCEEAAKVYNIAGKLVRRFHPRTGIFHL